MIFEATSTQTGQCLEKFFSKFVNISCPTPVSVSGSGCYILLVSELWFSRF